MTWQDRYPFTEMTVLEIAKTVCFKALAGKKSGQAGSHYSWKEAD